MSLAQCCLNATIACNWFIDSVSAFLSFLDGSAALPPLFFPLSIFSITHKARQIINL
jgi:hypothetical protein